MSKRGRRWLTALAVAATLTTACNGDDDTNAAPVITDPVDSSSSSTSSTSSTTSTTDPQAEVKAEVEAAYLAYWDAFLEIFAEPDPANPLIDQHATSAVREAILDDLSADIQHGRSIQRPENPDDFAVAVLDVTMAGPTQAAVHACVIDGAILIQNSTGEVINDDLVTKLMEATMIREDDRWKVASLTTVEKRDGRWTCDD